MGLGPDTLSGVPFDAAQLHTRTESEAVVRWARRTNLDTLALVAAPFHQLRAFMTAVTVVEEAGADLRLYSIPGAPLPWSASVAHSQGTLTAPRHALIASERERIARYQAKGDLGSFDQVRAYLDRR